eukprot:PhF_6_TR12263/c0_g1_i1/m.19432
MADDDEKATAMALQHTALIASTMANFELINLKKALSERNEMCNQLQQRNNELVNEMKERDRDALQVVEFLRREVEKKQDVIEQTRRQVDQVQELGERKLQQEVSRLMFELKKKEEALEKAEDDIRRLEDEIESIAEFKRQKHELTQELTTMRQQLLETKERYERELSRANFVALEERVRLKGEKKEFMDKFTSEVNTKAMSMLDEKTRRIFEENRSLVEEKKVLELEVHNLTTRLAEVTAHLTTKARELDLATQSHELIGKQGYRLRKEVQQLSNRNGSLEDTVRKVAENYEVEMQKLRTAHDTQVGALADTVQTLRNAVDTRTRELRKVRSLARTVVQQRSELESFFYEALDYVKDKRRDGHLPALPSPTTAEQLPPAEADPNRVDISQLTWDDKERVLRILFAKINSTGQKTPAPPPQPLSIASSASNSAKGSKGTNFFITEGPNVQT